MVLQAPALIPNPGSGTSPVRRHVPLDRTLQRHVHRRVSRSPATIRLVGRSIPCVGGGIPTAGGVISLVR
jgi:hypothetical protein